MDVVLKWDALVGWLYDWPVECTRKAQHNQGARCISSEKIDFLSRIVFYRFTSHPPHDWRPIGDHSRDLVDLVDLVVLSCLCDANTSSYSTDIPCPDSICLPRVACIPSVTPVTCHRILATTANRIVAAHRTPHRHPVTPPVPDHVYFACPVLSPRPIHQRNVSSLWTMVHPTRERLRHRPVFPVFPVRRVVACGDADGDGVVHHLLIYVDIC